MQLKSKVRCNALIKIMIDAMVVREMGRRCNFDRNQVEKIRLMVSGGTRTDRKKDAALMRVLALADKHEFFSAVVLEYLDEQNYGLLTTAQCQKLQDLLSTMTKRFELLAIHD